MPTVPYCKLYVAANSRAHTATVTHAGILSAMPDTNYRAATNVIYRWEKDFPETFAKFQEAIDEPVGVLIERLENSDVVAYETFERIYPTLTAGSVFNLFWKLRRRGDRASNYRSDR